MQEQPVSRQPRPQPTRRLRCSADAGVAATNVVAAAVRFARMKTLLTLLIAGALSSLVLAADPQTTAHETDDQFEQRTAWWRQAKFGMFIHWGIYSVPADSSKGAA